MRMVNCSRSAGCGEPGAVINVGLSALLKGAFRPAPVGVTNGVSASSVGHSALRVILTQAV